MNDISPTMKIIYSLYFTVITTTILVSSQKTETTTTPPTKLGACERLSKGEFRCAYQKSDCEPNYIDGIKNVKGEKWWQPYRLDYDDKQENCACDGDTAVGACVVTAGEDDMLYRCAPNAHACAEDEVFYSSTSWPFPGDSWCGCDRKWTEDSGRMTMGQMTLYGACWNDGLKQGICALDPENCEAPFDTWLDAVSVRDVLGQDCTCSDVIIGGCFGGRFGGYEGFHCAVSNDTCFTGTYYSPKAMAQFDSVSDCRLCPKEVAAGTVPYKPKHASQTNNSSQKSDTSMTIGWVSFSAVLLFTFLGFGTFKVLKRSQHKRTFENEQFDGMRNFDKIGNFDGDLELDVVVTDIS